MKLLRQFRAWLRREHLDAEMTEELHAHLEMQEAENRARGMTPEEARHAARRQFGGVEQIKEIARDGRGLRWLDELRQDLRYAGRKFGKAPGFTAVVVLSLAVGIGANTTVFSWLNGALFHPLPGVTANLFAIEARNAAGTYPGSSWLEFKDLAERLPAFASLVAQRPRMLGLGDSEKGERIWGELVSGDFFATLGVRPVLGRFFRSAEAMAPGGDPVAVVSYRFWRQRLGGRPDAIGRTIKLNNRVFTVIGVAPEDFAGGWTTLAFEVWVPLTMATELTPASKELTTRDYRAYILLGALKPGASVVEAREELAAATRALAAEHPGANADIRFELTPLWRSPRGGVLVRGAATLQLFAALLLVIVCVNTANLLLARASVRRREIGIRLACGAGASRVMRQLLVESLMLGFAGAALGAVFSWWGVGALRHLSVPTNVPVQLFVTLDWRGLAFAAGTGLTCGVLFGLAPALQLVRGDLQQALRGGRGAVSGRSWLRDALVAVEVAVALVVLVLAGLFLKSFRNAQTFNAGSGSNRVLLVTSDFIGRAYTRTEMRSFLREAQTRLAEIPGVEAIAAINILPLDVRGMQKATVGIDGAPAAAGDRSEIVYFGATDGYFAAIGLPFIGGRDLAPVDDAKRPLDAVINEEMARRFWPDLSATYGPGAGPLGHRINVDDVDYEVVGVVPNAKYESVSERPQPAVWLTARHVMFGNPVFHLRLTAGDPLRLLPAVRAAFHGLDPELSIYGGRSLAQHLDSSLFLQRTPAQMLGWLGPLALALAALGLYAVLAHSLAQRTQEIGVRLTLGATPGSVVVLMLREGMRVVLAGAALGWAVAFGFGWFFRAKLVGVPLGDPVIYAGVPVLLLAIAALACWLPARKAAWVDPMVALRAE